jgi:hypothetical protein
MKRVTLSLMIAVLFALSISASALADVIGFFQTNISFTAQSTDTEISLLNFDITNNLSVTASLSGITTNFHAHFGFAGFEDTIITTQAVLGMLSASSQFTFSRFNSFAVFPFYPAAPLHFTRSALDLNLNIVGVSLSNLSSVEDTNIFASQSAAYAFGNLITLTGQTVNGVGITARAAFCMEQASFQIKHHSLSSFRVNPDCATDPKPDLLFDFEQINITGVQLAPNIIGSAFITCIQVNACSLITTVSMNGGVIPVSLSATFIDLLTLQFNNAVIRFISSFGSLSINFGATGSISAINLNLNLILNPEESPATLSTNLSISPGVGLIFASMFVRISRGPLSLNLGSFFSGGPPASLDFVRAELDITQGIYRFESQFDFDTDALRSGDLFMTINF